MDDAKLNRWQYITMGTLFTGYAGYYICRSNFSVATPLILQEFAIPRQKCPGAGVNSQFRDLIRLDSQGFPPILVGQPPYQRLEVQVPVGNMNGKNAVRLQMAFVNPKALLGNKVDRYRVG